MDSKVTYREDVVDIAQSEWLVKQEYNPLRRIVCEAFKLIGVILWKDAEDVVMYIDVKTIRVPNEVHVNFPIW